MEEALGILVLEDGNGQIEPVSEVVVDLLHHQQGDILVGDAADECVLQHMGEGAVADVMHEDGGLYRLRFRVEDELSLLLKGEDGLAHQVKSPQ